MVLEACRAAGGTSNPLATGKLALNWLLCLVLVVVAAAVVVVVVIVVVVLLLVVVTGWGEGGLVVG